MTDVVTTMFPDGLASAPGLSFESEPDTGLFKKADEKIGIAVGGVEVGEINANGLSGAVMVKEITFTETSAATTLSGTINLPAGARIIDIGVDGTALWSATTAASIVVGDAASATGFFVATNLVSTDLLAGEINNIEHPGGKAGAYIASEQRVLYSPTARAITATVTKAGNGNSGRTRVYVAYAVPTSVAGA